MKRRSDNDDLGVSDRLYQGFAEEDPNVFYLAIGEYLIKFHTFILISSLGYVVWTADGAKLSDHSEITSTLTPLAATPPKHYHTTLNGVVDISVDAPATEILSLRLKGGYEFKELDEIMQVMAKDINEGKVEGALVPCVWGPAKHLSAGPDEPAGIPFLSFAGWTTSDVSALDYFVALRST